MMWWSLSGTLDVCIDEEELRMPVINAPGYFVFVRIVNPETDPTPDNHISPAKRKKKGGGWVGLVDLPIWSFMGACLK